MRPQAELNILSLRNNIPLSATIELTRRCAYSCVHCYLPETRGNRTHRWKKELSPGELEKLFRELKNLGSMSLSLTGGEPLLRKDFPEICALAVKYNFDAAIFTSLYPADENLLEKIRKTGVKKLEVSLYGRKKIYERVTGTENSFKKVLENLETARKKGFKIKIKTPLLKLNRGEISWLYSFCKKNGFSLGIDPQLTPMNDGNRKNLILKAERKDIESLFRKEWFKPEKNRDGDEGKAGPVCGAGRNVVSVDPYGNVYPCLQLMKKAGNIRKKSLSFIWKKSGKLQAIRKTLSRPAGKCLRCPDLNFCSRCPGISALNGKGLSGTYPDACFLAKLNKKMLQ